MEIRIILSHTDFRCLVQGQVAEVVAEAPVRGHPTQKIKAKIVLQDIGFQAMTAEVNAARRLTDERHRKEALDKGRCRHCGKGGLESFAGAARCTACGRLQ